MSCLVWHRLGGYGEDLRNPSVSARPAGVETSMGVWPCSAYVKFRKDVNDVLAMEDSEAIVPLSNKHQESFFAYYKRYEHLFLHMTDGMIEIVAKAKLNKVTFLN